LTDFASLLRALAEANVHFILVGGAAATAHGSARLTADVDVVHERSAENLERAAGRPKDLEAIAELETIAEERKERR
jgi:hypothetical protein